MTDPARAPATGPSAPHPAPPPADEPDCADPGLPAAQTARPAAAATLAPAAPADYPGAPPPGLSRDDASGYGPGPDNGGCTQAQLRRFVKSRPYVPLHELRRRFGIGGPEDEVSPIAVNGRTLFIGLPSREAGLLGELIRTGDAGYELLLDPDGPMIVGVWPTRPVQRG